VAVYSNSTISSGIYGIARLESGYYSFMSALAELDTFRPPRLESRAPTTSVVDEWEATRFIQQAVQPTGVHEPTTLVLNLEGRPPTPAGAYQLVVEVGQRIKSGAWAGIAVVLASSDSSLKAVCQALAETHELPLFWARSVADISQAEPLGKLTPAERETLEALRRQGGIATVGLLADAIGADHTAIGNRVNNLDKRHFIFRIDRPRPSGHVYMDWRIADSGAVSTSPGSSGVTVSTSWQSDIGALAAMQGVASPEELASAWREFLEKHRDELAQTHERARDAISRRDEAGIAGLAQTHARIRARSRARKADL